MKITQKISIIRKLTAPYFKAYFAPIMMVILMCNVLTVVPQLIANVFFYDNDFIYAAFQSYGILITAPLTFGEAILFLSAFRNQCAGLNSLAYGFQYFNKSLVLAISVYARVLLGLFLFFIPGIYLMIKYSLAFYVLADNPGYSPKRCLSESARLTKDNKLVILKLFISYLPLILVSTLPRLVLAYYTMEMPLIITEKTFMMSLVYSWSTPLCALVGLLTLIPESQFLVGLACLYDISAEKLVFKEDRDITECEPTIA